MKDAALDFGLFFGSCLGHRQLIAATVGAGARQRHFVHFTIRSSAARR